MKLGDLEFEFGKGLDDVSMETKFREEIPAFGESLGFSRLFHIVVKCVIRRSFRSTASSVTLRRRAW
jgi:hypothetical protein